MRNWKILHKILICNSFIILSTLPTFGQRIQPIGNHLDLVDTSNGALRLRYTDFMIPARGEDLNFVRVYNNQSQYNGPLGHNWHFNWNLTLNYRPSETVKAMKRIYEEGNTIPTTIIGPTIKTTPEKVTIIETNGFLREFKKEEDKFVSIHFDIVTVKRIEGGFILEYLDGRKYYFTRLIEKAPMPIPPNTQKIWIDSKGNKHIEIKYFSNSGEREVYKLSKIVDRYGNTTVFDYDSRNRLISITDPAGRGLTFRYTPKDKLQTITDPLGRKVTFEYNHQDELVKVIDPAGSVITFEYDTRHNITKITYPGDAILMIRYDRNNRVESLTGPVDNTTYFSYQTTGQGKGLITTITDALGNKTIHD